MAAVDDLLLRLGRIDTVVDEAAKMSGVTSPELVDHALRGVAVQGLSSFEQFLRDRGSEWADHLTQARISAASLSGGTLAFSDRIVQTLPRRFRDLDDSQRSTLVQELATTMTSFSSGNLVGHDLFFAWSGSNVQTSDVDGIVRLVGLKGWGDLTAAWKVLDPRFPGNASAEKIMKDFSSQRHMYAHQVDASINPTAVSTITRNVKLTAMLLDMVVSAALQQIARGLTVPTGIGNSLTLRHITRDGSYWSEFPPSKARAYRRHASLGEALSAATPRARAKDEVIVVFDQNDIVDWRAAI
ncbi:hypothetical protein DEJ03_12650 [Curtobacterium sp. MCLR17_043]|uniref:hypothetical protein n=1 Tax=Curtobacterium sp. MCLR17_043 TaxID=2175627 RepID=UPI000D8A1E00|nr:hypothetical protein [Curtobacterium sp. MCLR17_043]PYY44010.1 hypothetical protein DEJ03_12650 [Curtobacterium sp. MCLR17_043]